MSARPDIVISGAGAACAVGTGCDALWDALSRGADGLLPVKRFKVDDFGLERSGGPVKDASPNVEPEARVAGLWPGWDAEPPEGRAAFELALAACHEAWAQARVRETDPSRVAVILGTCFGEDLTGFTELAARVADALGARGPSFIVSTACSSSTTAIGLGRDLIERGDADVVLAGGVDVMTRGVFAGFHAIGVMSAQKCAPFGGPPGLTLGEGAGVVVLESAARAQNVLGHVLGYGLSADAHHETAPEPSGAGVARAIRAALSDAGVDGVDFVSAHGTGTDSNDAAEWLGVRAALGVDSIPISSTKSFIGHTQGAAGALELIAMLLCMKRGLVPQSLRASPLRAGVPASVLASERPVALPVRRALKLSAAFGGANSALVVGREASVRTLARRRVSIAGVAALSARGFGVEALEGDVLLGRVPDFELTKYVRQAPDRDVDPSGRFCTTAAALALSDAGLTVRGAARERTGLFTGSTRMPALSVHETHASIKKRGITKLAAVPFTHMVLNAPAGLCAKLLSLRGPHLAVCAGQASGLFAIIRAAEHLAARACADVLVAGGLDELPVPGAAVAERDATRELVPPPPPPGALTEGAAFAVLVAHTEQDAFAVPVAHPERSGREADAESKGAASRRSETIELSGWGVAGPRDVATAVARALEHCGEVDGVLAVLPDLSSLNGTAAERTPLGTFDARAVFGHAEATASAYAFVLAVSKIRRGLARRLLVVAASETLSCAAVVSQELPHGQ